MTTKWKMIGVRVLSIASTVLVVSSVSADWSWDGTTDPNFIVEGVVENAYYLSDQDVYVVEFPAVDNPQVAAHRIVGDYAGDFSVTVRFLYVSSGYDLAIYITEGSFDYSDPPGCAADWVSAKFHDGWHNALGAGSKNDSGSDEYDVLFGHPQAGNWYEVELGRTGNMMYAYFYVVDGGVPALLAEEEWTSYNPDSALTDLYLVGSGDDLWGDGEAHFTTIDVTGEEPCDICVGTDCDYTCLNVDNVNVSPTEATPGETITVDLDYFVSGTDGHIIYVGIALGDECVGQIYGGVPGQNGASGYGEVTFEAPAAAGCDPISVAVAHVYDYAELCAAIADGSADTLRIGMLTVEFSEDFPGPDLAEHWQSIGNGEWDWDSEGDGIAKQTHGPVDDNLSVLKLLDEHFEDFELTARWRQDAGPTISSGLQLLFRMGDEPGPGADVPDIGPTYLVSWGMTPAQYPHPDISLQYCEGWSQAASDIYYPVGCETLASESLNWDAPWFGLDDWRRTRVRAVGQNLKVYVDYDSSDPSVDTDADFVLVFDVNDPRLNDGTVALNDHYANTSWDYVDVRPICGLGDLNCDGSINSLDIDPFVLALTSEADYYLEFPHCDAFNADINSDGSINSLDIDPFVSLLTGG